MRSKTETPRRRLVWTRNWVYTTVARWLLRGPLLAALRRWWPIAGIRRVWIVTRYEDVCKVLDRDQEFTVPYGRRMNALIGEFVIGMDDGPRHRRAREVLDRADHRHSPGAHRAALERIECQAAETAAALLDAADGSIDVVRGLSEPVVHAGIVDYIGIDVPAATLFKWCRSIGWDVFLNPQGNARVAREAEEAATAIRAILDARIDERRCVLSHTDAEPNGNTTLLDRLLVLDPSSEAQDAVDHKALRATIAGLILVWAVSIPRATALAVDELLRRRELARARSAAQAGDDDLLARHLFEALRFETLAPALPRVCSGTRLGRGAQARDIPAAATVIAFTGSAMTDPRAVRRPRRFRADRDRRDYTLHFGRGAHSCWGEGIATAQMVAIAKALLAREGLKRAPGPAGKLIIEGAFPTQLGVTFAPERT